MMMVVVDGSVFVSFVFNIESKHYKVSYFSDCLCLTLNLCLERVDLEVVPRLVVSVEALPNALEKVSIGIFNVTSFRPH